MRWGGRVLLEHGTTQLLDQYKYFLYTPWNAAVVQVLILNLLEIFEGQHTTPKTKQTIEQEKNDTGEGGGGGWRYTSITTYSTELFAG